MITGSIAKRWAKALFSLGEEQRNLIGLVREVARSAEAWVNSEELRVTMGNPMLSEKIRMSVWNSIIRKLGVTRTCKNFLKLLFEKGRLAELASISQELQKLADTKDNRVRAEIISAVALSDDVITKLKLAISKSSGKMVVITKREDPELIGGIVTRVGDLMYDGSIKTQLSRIKEEMLKG